MSTPILGSFSFTDKPTVGGVDVALMTDISASPSVVLAVYSGTTAAVSGTTLIPSDTTIPLSTEGTQLWLLGVTPASTASKFIIRQSFMYDCGTANRNITFAVFRGTTCIYAVCGNLITAGRPLTASISVYDAPASATAVTYSLRVGVSRSATWFVNQNNGSAITFGGTANRSTYTITELA